MNIIQRIHSWILSMPYLYNKKIKSLQQIQEPKKQDKCEICQLNLTFKINFKCPYCKKHHCDKHRLPEEHKCPNPKTPKGMTGGRIIYSGSKTTYVNN